MTDETWRTDMALDFYNRLPESQRATFRESYLRGIQEHLANGECPACVGVKHLSGPDADGYRQCPTTGRKFRATL